MTTVVIILCLAGGLVGGFLAGVWYCIHRMLGQVFARLSPKEQTKVVQEASRISGLERRE